MCRCAFSNCQHLQEPGCCLHEDFDRHPIYVELYHEVKQNEDLERHRSMSKKVMLVVDVLMHVHTQSSCNEATSAKSVTGLKRHMHIV